MSSRFNNAEGIGENGRPQPSNVSNLTKNLLSQQQMHNQPVQDRRTRGSTSHQASSSPYAIATNPQHPNGQTYGGSYNSSNRFIPSGTSLPHTIDYGNVGSVPNQFNSFSYSGQSGMLKSNPGVTFSHNESFNYIPSSHNTPTVVSSSYSSNHSYTPSLYGYPQQSQFQQSNEGGLKHIGTTGHGYPTTNISMDVANRTTNQGHAAVGSNTNNSLNKSVYPNNEVPFANESSMQSSGDSTYEDSSKNADSLPKTQKADQPFIPQPDRYKTYDEFFKEISSQDSENPEEHLNIVDYPVNDLIMMLACLLNKIIEANDKLHPNHFDHTIAMRRKMRDESRAKKVEKMRKVSVPTSTIDPHGNRYNEEVVDVDESDDDNEDELKNKYLANVLAFHGTNIPGISLHSYLTRVLKYCPVTNEVFLSLLVYFDRIAKKANNLKSSRASHSNDMEEQNDPEQLFVMDSYNIHRLIISGITVSSKFFSDVFYKNLRYAKVGGLPLEELNYLELQFLLLLDFKLMICVEDLQNYGDLLLRFWKREQLANNTPETAQDQNQAAPPAQHTQLRDDNRYQDYGKKPVLQQHNPPITSSNNSHIQQ
ncbi:Piso0_004806 [Millerozyma farinosa CBS 7064]|uniref:Piso0_004806 protein n=1 Tax=Pichia sorbitophila (strain ATCC MYA-4447 / BCRC 22081 / CBS 7064 / NBRC 10061 / NRRL Y-12695) TaxID=559304 RepID=G8Y0H0_PICSO|nr:Piso0_004806 [Millerozyma farinosa CBS 7064]